MRHGTGLPDCCRWQRPCLQIPPDFNPIYTRVVGASPDVTFSSPSADGQGEVAFVLRNGSSSSAVKLDTNGEVTWSSDDP